MKKQTSPSRKSDLVEDKRTRSTPILQLYSSDHELDSCISRQLTIEPAVFPHNSVVQFNNGGQEDFIYRPLSSSASNLAFSQSDSSSDSFSRTKTDTVKPRPKLKRTSMEFKPPSRCNKRESLQLSSNGSTIISESPRRETNYHRLLDESFFAFCDDQENTPLIQRPNKPLSSPRYSIACVVACIISVVICLAIPTIYMYTIV